jgi:hypothetical protein
MKLSTIAALLLVIGSASMLAACSGGGDSRWLRVADPDEEGADENIPRKEDALALPPFPVGDRLLEVAIGGASRNAYFVDPASITVGQDWVIRYTVVVRSPSGAKTISYEGLNCTDYEYKIYATGRPDGTWAEAKRPQWSHVRYTELNRYRIVLFTDFFCPKKVPVRSSGEAVRALKAGNHVRAQDSY